MPPPEMGLNDTLARFESALQKAHLREDQLIKELDFSFHNIEEYDKEEMKQATKEEKVEEKE